MEDQEATIRGRQLGDELRMVLDGAGLSGREIARRLGWSDSRVSRLLSGKRGCSEVDLSAFLAVCRTVGARRERLLRLCREANKPGLLEQFGQRLPRQLRTLADLEDNAAEIGDFQPNVVPGMLQTEDYARALITETGNAPPGELDERVAARMARQQLLGKMPPIRFTFFVHELVLWLPVGGGEVMSAQLHHLLRLAVRPNISLRVVPRARGGHPGTAGPFKLLDIAEFKPVVYLDSETASLFLEDPPEIEAYRRIVRALADVALDERQSRQRIAELAIELYPHREDHDERP